MSEMEYKLGRCSVVAALNWHSTCKSLPRLASSDWIVALALGILFNREPIDNFSVEAALIVAHI